MKSAADTPMVVSSCEPPKNVFSIPTPNNDMRDYDPDRVLGTGSFAADWQATLSKEPPGNFPELRPLRASYRFGWSGVTAATGEVHFTKPSNDRFQLEGTGRTMGFVRALWKLDVTSRAVANSQTLAPIETQQSESYRSKKIATHLTFTNSGVTRTRTEGEGAAAKTTTRDFALPNLFDLHSAALYLRSQPLKQGSVYRLRFTRQQTLTWPL